MQTNPNPAQSGGIISCLRPNFRVRDGNGCLPFAITTENFISVTANLDMGYKLCDGTYVYPNVAIVGGLQSQGAEGEAIVRLLRSLGNAGSGVLRLLHRWGLLFCGQASRPISTGKLNTLLCLHTRPINLVVFKGSSGNLRCGISCLGVGFPLRCFQRLSFPNLGFAQKEICIFRC